jgi:MoaA/NifB/PqqE/SkfB family radical SAM enzyme
MEKIRRLVEWSKGGKVPPFTLDINPTDRCNLKCIHCWQRAFKNIDSNYELTDEELIRIVKEGIKLGVREFEITGGGEPMMRKKLTLNLVEIIKKNKRFGNITTNGTLFDSSDAKRIVKMNWDRITFSLDGPDPETNDFVRGEGTFEKVMQTISLFNQTKEKSKKKLPLIKFNVVVNRKNYDKLNEMIELARECNCSIVHFDSLTVHSEAGKKLRLTKKQRIEFEKNAKKAKELADKYGIWTDVNFLTNEFLEKSNEMEEILRKESDSKDFSSLVCYEPWWHLVIKTNGTAQPCCLYDEKEEDVRNKSLREIWFGKFFEEIRTNIKNKKFSKYCSICNAGQVFENRRIREDLNRWMKK